MDLSRVPIYPSIIIFRIGAMHDQQLSLRVLQFNLYYLFFMRRINVQITYHLTIYIYTQWRIQCVTSVYPQIKKKIKKNLVGIYKFKNYGFAKVSTVIFVLNSPFSFQKKKKKKIRNINLSKLQQTTQTIQNYNIHYT